MGEMPPDLTGQVLVDRYEITGLLGSGAMAHVYEALDLHSNVAVAVKLLNEGIQDRTVYHERFEREAVITAKFRHPICIRILDYGMTRDGRPYQVTEVVRGRMLADILDDEERLPLGRALHIFRQLLYALVECADAGVIHRDIKPENLLIYDHEGQRDALKLIDFGISKLIGEAAVGHEKLTSVGLILGTPHYIAPEWMIRDDVDCRADLYSATILLYEMLTSAPPFLSEDRKTLMRMHLNQVPPTLHERIPTEHFSDGLEALVRKGLAKDPDQRFSDAREYLAALAEVFEGPSAAELGKRPSQRVTAPRKLVSNKFNANSLERLASQPLDITLPLEAVRCFSDEKHQVPRPVSSPLPDAAFGSGVRLPIPPSIGAGVAAGNNSQAAPPAPLVPSKRPKLSSAMWGAGAGVLVLATLAVLASQGGEGERRSGSDDAAAVALGSEAATSDLPKPDAKVKTKAKAKTKTKTKAKTKTKTKTKPRPERAAITKAQINAVLAALNKKGLSTTGFSADLKDNLANGACLYGKAEALRLLICLPDSDPLDSPKPMKRPAPGDKIPRRWRTRIDRGGLHLRVQETGRNKKRKKLRRKIERILKSL